MLTKEGEQRLLTHIETVGGSVNKTDWTCPICKVKVKS